MTPTQNNNIASFLTEKETEDLELHVRVCAERYSGLSERMDKLEEKVDNLNESLNKFRAEVFKVGMGTAGTIIAAIIAGIFAIYSK